ALGSLGDVHEAAELPLEHAIVVTELLLLDQADAVLGVAPAAVAVHAGDLQFLAGVLVGVRDGHADATGQFDFRSGVTGHGRTTRSFSGQREATKSWWGSSTYTL